MNEKDTVNKLLEKYGQTFSEEIGIDLEKGTPSALFQWLCCVNLFSARIGSDISAKAGKSLIDAGWRTADKMKDSTWHQRVSVLNKAHYTRYQERTSTFLGDVSETLLEKYQGDLNNLRENAKRDPKKIRSLLKEFKGLGDVGVDIFFREIQSVWDELYPFVDGKAKKGAERLGLPKSTERIAQMVNKKDLPKLLAALVRADLNNDYGLDKDEDQEKESKKKPAKSKDRPATKGALYKEAKKRNIKGRSQMDKSELRKALEEKDKG